MSASVSHTTGAARAYPEGGGYAYVSSKSLLRHRRIHSRRGAVSRLFLFLLRSSLPDRTDLPHPRPYGPRRAHRPHRAYRAYRSHRAYRAYRAHRTYRAHRGGLFRKDDRL